MWHGIIISTLQDKKHGIVLKLSGKTARVTLQARLKSEVPREKRVGGVGSEEWGVMDGYTKK